MKLRNITLALAFCVPLVSTSYAQDKVEGAIGEEAYSARSTKHREKRRARPMQAAKKNPHQGGAARSVTPPRAPQK
jgi:hypothetical protein